MRLLFICLSIGAAAAGLLLAVHVFVRPADNIIGLLATAAIGGSGIPALALYAIPWLERQRIALEAQCLEEK